MWASIRDVTRCCVLIPDTTLVVVYCTNRIEEDLKNVTIKHSVVSNVLLVSAHGLIPSAITRFCLFIFYAADF